MEKLKCGMFVCQVWKHSLGVGLMFLLPLALFAQEAPQYKAEARLNAPNFTFRDEAILVTTFALPFEFICQAQLSPSPPAGYTPAPTEYQWTVSSGRLEVEGNQCTWIDPEPGLQTIQVEGVIRYLPPPASSIFSWQKPEISAMFQAQEQLLVPVRSNLANDTVNGFLIGDYPDPNDAQTLQAIGPKYLQKRITDHIEVYQPPKLFYEVTEESWGLAFYEGYSLGDFDLDPRFSDLTYPRYIALHPTIVRKLVLFETFLQSQGISVSKFDIFYGFRSPAYNLGEMNKDGEDSLKTPFSMHMYGRAADFIIDEDGDLRLDDLNGDGKLSVDDSRELKRLGLAFSRQLMQAGSDELIGGVGNYFHHDYWERGEYAQTPYLHLDTRGFTAENGTIIEWETRPTIDVSLRNDPYRLKKPVPNFPFF